jgi:hypothetical protein
MNVESVPYEEKRRSDRAMARPFRETRMPAALRIPRWLGALLSIALAAGPAAGLAPRGKPVRHRVLRSILVGSTLAYFITASVDLAEHFRLEKEITGRLLRWTAIPPIEALTHAAIVANNVGVLLLARPLRRRRPGLLDRWLLVAPAAFIALGWGDELVFHRRRTGHREDLIHTTQHLAEAVMWTTLYATRVARP